MKIPKYLRRAGTSIAKNFASAAVRASDRLTGGKIKIPKALRKAGSKIGNALLEKGTEMAIRGLVGAGTPRYLRKAGTSIAKNFARAAVRGSEKLTGGCVGGSIARIYDPISGRFLQSQMKGSGFRSIGGSGFVPN